MKKIYLLFVFVLLAGFGYSQTNPGDIAIIAANADGGDDFAFVALIEIAAGAEIYFTDNEWDGSAFNDLNEGELTWTNGASPLRAGSVVVFTNPSSFGSVNVGSYSNSGFDLGSLNDWFYALLSPPATSYGSTPTFLAAFATDAGSGWLTNTGLTEGTHAIDFDNDHDGFKYTGNRSGQASYSAYLSLIYNSSNWQDEADDGENILPISIADFGPQNPTDFHANGLGALIVIGYTPNENGDDIMIVYDFDNTFTDPVDGTVYPESSSSLGGTVLFQGTTGGFIHGDPGIHYYYKAWSVDGYNNYSSGVTADARTIYYEPYYHASDFTVDLGIPSTSTIEMSWTHDESFGTLPEAYLIKGSTISYAAITDPSDGSVEADGSLVLNVDYGVEYAEFTGLTHNTTYYFKIFPYTNSGIEIDYKTDGTVPSGSATTDEIIEGLQLSSVNTIYTIDFDNTVTNVNKGQYNGTGISSTPSPGQLNSSAWGVIGLEDGNLVFGADRTSGDFAKGPSSGGVTSGGIYAFEVSPSNYAFGVQATSKDWTPGYVTLRLQNSTGTALTSLDFNYTLYILNNEGGSLSFNFDYSSDNSNFTDIPDLDFVSDEVVDSSPEWKAYKFISKITGLNISDGDFFYLSWKGDEFSASGLSDEFAIDDISIAGNFISAFEVSGEIEDLVLSTSANAQVASSNDFTINGDFNNKGTFTIKSDATGDGSVIVEGTMTGGMDIERYIPAYTGNDNGWHLLSSPRTATFNLSTSDFVPTSGVDDVYNWNEVSYEWENFYGSQNPNFDFVPGYGYLVAYQTDNPIRTFAGSMNNENIAVGDLTITDNNPDAADDGWHLLGNPYTSALQWNDGNWALFNVNKIAKVYNETGGNYADIPPEGFIPMNQGFFVQAKDGTGNLMIPLASRVHNASDWYKDMDAKQQSLKLKVSGGTNSFYDIINVNFNKDATEEFDMDYDSHKLSGMATAPQFYTQQISESFSTNTLPFKEGEIILPLSFIAGTSGAYQIDVQENTVSSEGDIYLEDLILNQTINISSQTSYSFDAAATDNPNRFLLHFNGVTVLEDIEEAQAPLVYAVDQAIYINSSLEVSANIFIYNINGQLVGQDIIIAQELKKMDIQMATGMYLVNIKTANAVYTQKVMIK